MKKHMGLLIFLVILSQQFLNPDFIAEANANADTRVIITISVGGAVGGAFFFLRFIFHPSLALESYQYDTALFNHNDNGWQIGFPVLNLIPDKHNDHFSLDNVPETIQMDILKIRF